MLSFAIRRILQTVPTVLAVVLVIFVLFSVVPGSVVSSMSDDGRGTADPQVVERMKKQLGLDDPVYIRFGAYIAKLATGDLGISFRTREPVTTMIAKRMWPTLQLIFAAMTLAIVIGVPLGSQLVLTDQLSFTAEPLPQPNSAVADALSHRAEVLISEAQVNMFKLERKAVKDEYLPSLQFIGDYGVSGITPTDTALPTRRAAVQLNVPIFNGGLTQGRLTVATSREHEAEFQMGSVRGQVEQDVRLAISTLQTTVERVRAADEALRLAERELEMSRDRFRAGVADNLEVINAQASLANARAGQVQALAVYNAARLNLAVALGRAEAFRW